MALAAIRPASVAVRLLGVSADSASWRAVQSGTRGRRSADAKPRRPLSVGGVSSCRMGHQGVDPKGSVALPRTSRLSGPCRHMSVRGSTNQPVLYGHPAQFRVR
jgi:hypothetical protein